MNEDAVTWWTFAHSHEFSNFIKFEKLFDQLSDYQLVAKVRVLWNYSKCIEIVTLLN
jgi:hypothetical protein